MSDSYMILGTGKEDNMRENSQTDNDMIVNM